MKIVTGNDLRSGAVIWWTGFGWSVDVNDAIEAGESADRVIATEQAARRAVSAYAIEASKDHQGVRPEHIKDRIRALGPTIRLDLSLKPASQEAGTWVI